MFLSLVSLLALAPASAIAVLQANLDDTASIKAAAKEVAEDLMAYYHGDEPGQTPGILPGPPPAGEYYWWQGGALWGTMIDYWHWTGDDTYNDVVYDAIQFQAGEKSDFMVLNWTASLGNDDQGFWGLTAIEAANFKFQDPPPDKPQWLGLAQGVFNDQTAPDRRDDTCGGGLRWQIFSTNNGYEYKNTIANALFFAISAQLARYTNNDTYSQWAEDTWTWLEALNYIDDDYNVYDGGHVEYNCTDVNKVQYSYNAAVLLLGAGYMYNYTGANAEWESRVTGLWQNVQRNFFPKGIAYEPSCEAAGHCDTDMLTFKGYLHRWLALTAVTAPYLRARILPVLKTSAAAAVRTCTGGPNQRQCGFAWQAGGFDSTGAGQQMDVLGALSSLLVVDAAPPVTNATGGTSLADPNAGGGTQDPDALGPVTGGDRAGAGIVTLLFVGAATLTLWWMVRGS
ncbi:glycoside hydrolase family 76 protein [Xylariomycetidae sp. FL0641]|nr:glycoside hydrolase family 76 protein [Xylariomycetidae sp. FL0641]